MTYRPELDGIRGIAILMVLAAHTFILPTAGRMGVGLFFVLSGYLITSILVRERERGGIDLRAFYERRIRRLVPALVAVVLVSAPVMLAVGQINRYPLAATSALLYVSDLTWAVGGNLSYLGHTWSLGLEEQFYLAWPLLLGLLGRRKLLVVVGLAIAGPVALRAFYPAADGPQFRLDAISAGCLLALVPLRLPRWAGIVGWVAIGGLLLADGATQLTGVTLAGSVIVATARPGLLSWRPLVRIGEISYGLYLWHYAPGVIARPWTVNGNLVAVALVFVASLALALASERWIERPFRRR